MRTSKILQPCPSPEELEQPEQPIVDKQSLRPKTGDDLPIDKVFVNTTQAMFYEYRYSTTCETQPPFCLKPYDFEAHGITYRSMYLIYMSCDSEYEAAIKILGSYPHWQRLASTNWFNEHLSKWKEEMSLREDALAKSKLVSLTERGNVTAARTLLSTAPKSVGRPKKAGTRKSDTKDESDLDAMLSRTHAANANVTLQ